MVGPDDLVDGLLQAQHGHAHQRRAGQVEAALEVPLEEGLQPRLLLLRRQAAPVVLLPGERDVAVDHLEGLGGAFPEEGGAQDGVVLHERLPGAPERGGVQQPVQPPARLHQVDAGGGLEERVEEHAPAAWG